MGQFFTMPLKGQGEKPTGRQGQSLARTNFLT